MIEDAIIVSTLASAALYLIYKTTKKQKVNNQQFIIERWTPETVQESPQSRYIIGNLKQRLQMLFPPPHMTRKKFTGILSMLNNRNLMAEIKLQEGPKSFTINKKQIFLCIKDKKSGDANYYDYNSLIFVTLHEIAHVLCDELGHTQKFQHIFKELLDHASSLGLYDETKPFVKNYCQS
ncbi:136R [Invertebrate iridescent virus Kaz2018]|nr:136R [Invertebrate iridescent virus Kaz2018]